MFICLYVNFYKLYYSAILMQIFVPSHCDKYLVLKCIKILSKKRRLNLLSIATTTRIKPTPNQICASENPTRVRVGLAWAGHNCNLGNQTRVLDLKLIWIIVCTKQKPVHKNKEANSWYPTHTIISSHVKWRLSQDTSLLVFYS